MKNKKVYGLVGVAALAAVGGTFAYYNATQTFTNPFDTSKYGTYAVEQFNPADGHNWEPGAEVDKKVYATNTGDADVWVRIKLEEKWSELSSDVDEGVKTISAQDVWDKNPTDGTSAGNNQALKDGETGDPTKNGNVAADTGSVVYKNFVNSIVEDSNAIGNNDWYYEDGWFYYTTALTPGNSTNGLLETVTLCGDTDMGLFENKQYYKVNTAGLTGISDLSPTFGANGEPTNGWVAFTGNITVDKDGNNVLPNGDKIAVGAGQTIYTHKSNSLVDGKHGYANAKYQLDIIVEFVQTVDAAADDMEWAWHPAVQ